MTVSSFSRLLCDSMSRINSDTTTFTSGSVSTSVWRHDLPDLAKQCRVGQLAIFLTSLNERLFKCGFIDKQRETLPFGGLIFCNADFVQLRGLGGRAARPPNFGAIFSRSPFSPRAGILLHFQQKLTCPPLGA